MSLFSFTQAEKDSSKMDEDVDGVPLDAEEIDGAPLSDSEDLDGNLLMKRYALVMSLI